MKKNFYMMDQLKVDIMTKYSIEKRAYKVRGIILNLIILKIKFIQKKPI